MCPLRVVPHVHTCFVPSLQEHEAVRVEQYRCAVVVGVAHVRRLKDDPLDLDGGELELRQDVVVMAFSICAPAGGP